MAKSSVKIYFENLAFDLESRLFPEALPFEIDLLNQFMGTLDFIISNFDSFDEDKYELYLGSDGKFYWKLINKKDETTTTL